MLTCLNHSWFHWQLLGDSPIVHPSPPLRRRRYGFGKTNPNLKIAHSSPSVYFVLHLTWDFLLPEELHQLTVATPVFVAYARQRRSALTMTIHSLHFPRQQIGIETCLMHEWAWKTAVALLCFNFHYGDLIHGVPLACDHKCSFESVRQRNLYDNHPGLDQVANKVWARFVKEEAHSFHIAFPWFVWRFIVGLHLAALVWVIRKMKGRLSTISPDDDGAANDHICAANDHIPKPGTMGHEDKCPPNLLLQCSEATPDMDLAIATDLAEGGYLPVRR